MSIKVLHLTTWEEICGIATYTNNLIKSLEKLGTYNEVYPINRCNLEYSSLDEIKSYFAKFCHIAKDFDVIHIQHEHGFFHGSYPFDKAIDIFHEILVSLKKQNKKVIVTFHTDPIFIQPISKIFKEGQRQFAKNISNTIQTIKWRTKIAPMFSSNKNTFIAIVHTKKSRLNLINSGFHPQSIQIIKHGICPRSSESYLQLSKNECKSRIGIHDNKKLISMFGFISKYKGYEVAIQALKYLPSKYHLAIIGGTHPHQKTDNTVDEILKLITELELTDRVRITGFVEFEVLDLFHSATDICIAPYLSSTLSASGALTWALNSGKPIIASKIPAFYELNQDANCMLMITPECPVELAWQIMNLDKNEQLQQTLVNNALNYVQENSWDNISTIHLDLYKKLLAQ